jgi:HK97 family phage major capsid protein
MASKLQVELKTLRESAQAIEQELGDSVWPEEKVTAYKAIVAKAEGIRTQIDVQTRADALKQWSEASDGQSAVRSNFSREATYGEGIIDGVTQDPISGELFAVKSEGEAQLKILKSPAYQDAFAMHMRAKSKLGPDWRAGMKATALKVLSAGTDEAGGFWMPPDYRSELIKKSAAMACVRPNATVITTGSDLVSFPTVKYTTDQKYTSGVRFAWNGDAPAANISEATNPIAGRDIIPINVATAAIFLARSMMEDNSFDVLGYISELMSEAFALGEEDAFWTGAGGGSPEGILAHAMATVANGTGDGMYVASGAAAAILWGSAATPSAAVTKGILGLEGALPPQYETNAKWYANKRTYSSIRGICDAESRPLWQTTDAPGLTNYVRGLPATLLGYDVQKSQFVPDIDTNTYPLVFGDMKGYYIADRVGLSIEVFREVLGLRDLVAIYARKRLGAALLQPWRLKDMKCTT